MAVKTTAIVPVQEVPDPFTGELIPISDRAKVAATLDAISEARANLDRARDAFTAALAEEAKIAGTRTFTAAGVKLVISGDTALEWDVQELMKLKKAGLPEERMQALIQSVVVYKVNGSVARQVAGSNPKYKRIIERAKTQNPKKAYVKVERS